MVRLFFTALLLISLLCFAFTALAQEETEEPTAVPTVEVTPDPLPLPDEIDVTPVIGDYNGNIDDFLNGAVIALNFIAFLVIAGLKWAIPGTQVKTETIYLFVVGIAALVYILATLAGLVEQLDAGVNFLNAIAEPLTNIILLLIGPALTYSVAKAGKVPALGDHQGDKSFSLQRAA
ncbi:MAG: hypothetical protein K8L99_31330 [Anaerolineae bacterium]|nr:hypothetical protein [Anaerolineae bacterium]